MSLLINIVRAVGGLIVTVIVVGIILVALDANEDNAIVNAILEIDRFFTGPFRRIVDLEKGKEHLQIAINWGIAAIVYGAISALIAAGLTRLGGRRVD